EIREGESSLELQSVTDGPLIWPRSSRRLIGQKTELARYDLRQGELIQIICASTENRFRKVGRRPAHFDAVAPRQVGAGAVLAQYRRDRLHGGFIDPVATVDRERIQ